MFAGEDIKKSIRRAEAKKRLKKDGEADISDLLSEEAKPEIKEKTPPRFITNDATAEALGQLMIDNPNGILFEADEL